jgi:hypothetical protein
MSSLSELSTLDTCEICGITICARCHAHSEKYERDHDRDHISSEDVLHCIHASTCVCSDGPAAEIDLDYDRDEAALRLDLVLRFIGRSDRLPQILHDALVDYREELKEYLYAPSSRREL